MSWTQERIDLLRVRWMQGLTAAQIMVQLNALQGEKISRSAVLGKVHRLGLAKRAQPSTPRVPGAKPQRKLYAAKAKREEAKAAREKVDGHKPRGAPRSDSNIPFNQHRDFVHCAMFVEGESLSTGLVCGKPAMKNSVYCEECAGRMFQPVVKREAA